MAAALVLLYFLSIISFCYTSVNIDCGTISESGVDENNITWIGDENFITTGECTTVSTTIEKAFTTLRYFPTGDTNCYSKIPVTKGGKVLVRTMFYYGNYDGKSSFPTFHILIDGKYRHEVILLSVSDFIIIELIFAPDAGEINVCFIRTTASKPFVSSIEVVDLAPGMYNELSPGECLFYKQRIAYGSKKIISWLGLGAAPNVYCHYFLARSDDHGRFWFPSGDRANNGLTSTAATIDTSGASNKPPDSILRNSWSGEGIKLGADTTFPEAGIPVYLALYFSNPVESDFRSFNIFFNHKQVNKDPVVPVFGKATQIIVRDLCTSSSTLEFRPTNNTISPPMINALELYVIKKPTSRGGVPAPGRPVGPEPGHGPGGDDGNKSNNLVLPLGIGIPVFVVGSLGYCIWKCITKRRKHHRLQSDGHGLNKQEVNVKVNVCNCWAAWTWCK